MNVETQLRRLPVQLRAAFAACCAERLLPAYQQYCVVRGIAPRLVDRLAFVWSVVLGLRVASAAEVRALFDDDSRTLVPPEERGTEYAQDAAISVLYALLSLAPDREDDTEGPVFAARHVTDALDRYAARLAGIQPDDPTYAERVTNNPILCDERERQQRDLNELGGLVQRKDEWKSALRGLRERAAPERIDCVLTPPASRRLS